MEISRNNLICTIGSFNCTRQRLDSGLWLHHGSLRVTGIWSRRDVSIIRTWNIRTLVTFVVLGLMQRGIRINPESKQLWIEYLKLELMYIEKIAMRKELLLGKSQESSVQVPDLTEESKSTPDPTAGIMPKGDEKMTILNQVPKAIFKNAVQCMLKSFVAWCCIHVDFNSFFTRFGVLPRGITSIWKLW